MTEQKKERVFIAAYLLTYLVIACSLAFAQPLNSSEPYYAGPPDEAARYLIPKYICEHGILPTGFEEEMMGAYGGLYAFRPSLPSILMGYLMRLMSRIGVHGQGLLYTARMVNVACGFVMAVVCYLLARRLFTDVRHRFLTVCGIMFLPQLLFLHTYINNDSMCLCSVVMMMYASYVICTEGVTEKHSLLLAAGWVMCLLTYYNAYGFVLCTGILYLTRFFEKKEGTVRFRRDLFLRHALPALLLTVTGAGWWFVRSFFLLDGDLFAMHITQGIHVEVGMQVARQEDGLKGVLAFLKEQDAWFTLRTSFIARYGSMSIFVRGWYYRIYYVLILCGCVFALCGLRYGILHWSAAQKRYCIAVCVSALITVALWLCYALYVDFQFQGRYILPAWPVFVIGAVEGGRVLEERLSRPRAAQTVSFLVLAWIMFAIIYYVYGVAFPVYVAAS